MIDPTQLGIQLRQTTDFLEVVLQRIIDQSSGATANSDVRNVAEIAKILNNVILTAHKVLSASALMVSTAECVDAAKANAEMCFNAIEMALIEGGYDERQQREIKYRVADLYEEHRIAWNERYFAEIEDKRRRGETAAAPKQLRSDSYDR